MNQPVNAVICLTSHGSRNAFLSKEARNAIDAEQSALLRIVWIPPRVETPDGEGAFVISDIVMFLAGVSFATIIKPVWEGVMKEAGKDIWSAIKRTIVRTRVEQGKQVYNVQGTAKIIFELHDEHVILRIPLPATGGNSPEQVQQETEQAVAKELKKLADSWDSVQKTINEFNVGKNGGCRSETGFHSIEDMGVGDKVGIVVDKYEGDSLIGIFRDH